MRHKTVFVFVGFLSFAGCVFFLQYGERSLQGLTSLATPAFLQAVNSTGTAKENARKTVQNTEASVRGASIIKHASNQLQQRRPDHTAADEQNTNSDLQDQPKIGSEPRFPVRKDRATPSAGKDRATPPARKDRATPPARKDLTTPQNKKHPTTPPARKDGKRVDSTEGEMWQPHKVLLFTYGRSGSSLTGDVIDHSPDVYYVFEPLKKLTRHRVNATIRSSVDLLQSLFTCNFTLSLLFNMDIPFLQHNNETSGLGSCVKQMNRVTPKQTQLCLQEAEVTCKAHTTILIKTIRLDMALAKQLMTLNPDLKVIFLIRDPRATSWSQVTLGWTDVKVMPKFSQGYCQRVHQDLDTARYLLKQHPGRLRFLRYEEFAEHPVRTAQQIYDFLHLNWNKGIQKRVEMQTGILKDSAVTTGQSTNSGNSRGTVLKESAYRPGYSVIRRDSKSAASQWRTNVTFDHVEIIQRECDAVMSRLGYRNFDTLETLRNMDYSNRQKFKLVEELNFPAADLGL
ncbi:carbohydrate sulfotransferase 1-like [Littorina saxatilis]